MPLESLRRATEHLVSLSRAGGGQTSLFTDVAAAVEGLCCSILRNEASGTPDATIREVLQPAWDIHGRSPFIRRLQTWPRGYPGDFETIERLLAGVVQARASTVEYWLEHLALHSPIAQQHRNKVLWQAGQIRRTLQQVDVRRPARILILAAGSSPDVDLVQEDLTERPCEIVLNDGDPEALAFSALRLSTVSHRVRFVPGNVLSSTRKLAHFGPYDLVLAGGLFDYLPNRHAEFLMRSVTDRLLAPEGCFCFTNLAEANPYRVWIEYLGQWRLIERSDEELRRIVAAGDPSQNVCSIHKESTGLTWLVSVTSQADPAHPSICTASTSAVVPTSAPSDPAASGSFGRHPMWSYQCGQSLTDQPDVTFTHPADPVRQGLRMDASLACDTISDRGCG